MTTTTLPEKSETSSIKFKINEDLLKAYKDILIKHLDERALKEDKVNSWMDNILEEAKEYFIKKYPNYDLFLYIYICPNNVFFMSYNSSISLIDSDWSNFVDLQTDYLYSILHFFYYKHFNLSYTLENCENEIIQKGNELLAKYLEGRKYNYDKINIYSQSINNEHADFILKKEKGLRAFFLNEIYQNPIQNKFYFKYLSYGKEYYSKIFQTYVNDSLTCFHYVFLFK